MLFREFNSNSNIRFLNALPSDFNVDIYANGKEIFNNLSFPKVTDYIEFTPGFYKFQLYKSSQFDSPLLTENISLLQNSVTTIVIAYEDDKVSFFLLDDTSLNKNPLLAHVRFMNFSKNAPILTLSLPDGITLFEDTSYLETTDYYPLSAGIYNFMVSSSNSSFVRYISDINLKKKDFITIYIVGLFNRMPRIGYVLLNDGNFII
ncbi:DUF4397 domain-containing protein [Clostridium sp. BJN0001]|uniref:DUF4397 domain-containing protein n=1 Tax=Clostridium sp. BJN0001 TaxID=2930219 RepID=UPI001FD09E3F|nr:DUF4397 domain-containing protein [Clostridium sp. BJN0001]